jgi:hypothetical protein
MPIIRVPIGLDGPVIDLGVWVGRRLAHAMVAQGKPVRSSQTVRALIDTGADRTAIHPNALDLIASIPAGTIRVRRPAVTTATRKFDLHDVRLAFGGESAPPARSAWVEIRAVAIIPADPNVLALIGRDMLAYCQFVYDGLNGALLLVY